MLERKRNLNVFRDAARSFQRKLRQEEGTDKYGFSTDVKGEYSARAGTTAVYFRGVAAKYLEDYL
jgi:hypothetical protein